MAEDAILRINKQRLNNNIKPITDLDNMTEKYNYFPSHSDRQFDRTLTDNATYFKKKTNLSNIDRSAGRSELASHSVDDTNFNIQSRDRISNEIQREHGLQTNEVEDRPTAMRLTGLRKPLSITDLYRGTYLL